MPWKDLVHTSGRVLKAMTFQPSGAVVAAPTTSLPEEVGGERNWDYRFSWVRDASLTMEALWVAACPDEAEDFFAFMTTAGAGGIGPDMSLQIMFGVGGEHDLSERTLDHLAGWRDSRPVRVGNGAWRQQQVDVYGELLGAAYRLTDQLQSLDADTRRFLAARVRPEKKYLRHDTRFGQRAHDIVQFFFYAISHFFDLCLFTVYILTIFNVTLSITWTTS